MKKYKLTITLLFFIVTTSFAQSKNINFGTYGIYWDWSSYTELSIKSNHTYNYLTKDFVGLGYQCTGKWILKKKKLILLGKCINEENYTFSEKHFRMPRKWRFKKNKIKNITSIDFPKSLDYKKNSRNSR